LPKKTHNTNLGKKGEKLAVEAMEAAGMSIIARNFRSMHGEIDIVAIDKETIVFIEVKTWSIYSIEELQYSLNKKKQYRIIETAKYFLSEHRKYSKMAIRFDVVFIKSGAVVHLASAFAECV